ncbi:serine/threonine-protein kinase [Gordonia asplenii]|uniref:serine/threonine-protein kinase n=1 Tax=Gordonia asplenii TaxID=2725283 RepID=UPI001FE89B1D|nr:serine/threonine-protein kinase [Gordonia asplenii]
MAEQGVAEAEQSIAGYRVIRQLGSGGMGEVYLVEHPRLPRRDALKLLNLPMSGNKDFALRFQREADLLAPLSHPNIVVLYDRGVFEGRLWLAMEFVDGVDAAQLLREHRALPLDTAFQLIAGAAAALDYAWQDHGITHRDVKPANILIARRGDGTFKTVKLADFGIAKAAGEATSLTSTGMAVGTMAYICPEALDGGLTDNRADVYSLGCTAFQLLTGSTPYEDATTMSALMAAHLRWPIPAVTARARHLPAGLDAVFTRVLAKHPEDRYQTCGEFVDELQAVITVDPVHTPTAVRPQSTPAGAESLPGPAGGDSAEVAGTTQIRPAVAADPIASRRRLGKRIAIIAAVAALVATVYGIAITKLADSHGGARSTPVSAATTPHVTATIRVGRSPSGVAVAPDGVTAYVTNRADNTVSVIDTATGRVTATIPVGVYPYDVAVTPNGMNVYVTNDYSNTVSVIDTATGKVTATIPVGNNAQRVAITPNGATAYVTNGGGSYASSVSVIDTASGRVTATIPAGKAPSGVAITPNGTTAYVVNVGDNTVSVIDTASDRVAANIPVGNSPEGVAVTPNGTTAYVTDNTATFAGTVSVIDTASGRVTATILVGSLPQDVAITPNGATAFVTDYDSNTVSVIDIASGKLTATIPVGNLPQDVAITPNGTTAYVTNGDDNTVSAIALK